MSGNIRIGQQLREGYNPDGTPGSASAGTPGSPGRPPTAEEIYTAVAAYLATNPIVATPTTNPMDAAAGNTQGKLTGALAEVVATPVYRYAGSEAIRRGMLLPDLPEELRSGELALLVATLWRAVQELSARLPPG